MLRAEVMKRVFALSVAVVLIPIAVMAQPTDSPEARRAAAARYLKVVPMEAMATDLLEGLAKHLPEARRQEAVNLMKKLLDNGRFEAKMLDVLAKNFTVSELEALEKFYGSADGQSIQRKFGAYMAELAPIIQAEALRVLEQARAELDL